MRQTMVAAAATIGDVLRGYAGRGVIQAVGDMPLTAGGMEYRLQWHDDRVLAVALDIGTRTVSFPALLPAVPSRSAMYAAFSAFVKSFASPERLPHRRVDPRKARIQCRNRRGTVSIGLKVVDGDFEYATRKLVHIAHEVFMVFLRDGPYYEYRVEHLGLDPDGGSG